MQKYCAIFLTTLMLAMSTPTHQVVRAVIKTGAFFHHFLHHLDSHQGKIGIMDFVHLHYSDDEHNEEGHAHHENLPFQRHHHDQQNLAPQTPCLLPHHHSIAAFPKLEIASDPLIFHSQQWCSSAYSGDIWQPPKG
ncbi:MAG: hypothetical protein KA138_05630 [Saprospiraceae bacterium]|nr:hypothetical protein [Saprospiraceae bacterium]